MADSFEGIVSLALRTGKNVPYGYKANGNRLTKADIISHIKNRSIMEDESAKLKEEFPCTKCGACCRRMGKLIAEVMEGAPWTSTILDGVLEEVRRFPHATINGVCEKYDPAIGCTVYEDRPDLCNIEKMYNKHYSGIIFSYEEYIQINAKGCNTLIDELGLDPNKKVIL